MPKSKRPGTSLTVARPVESFIRVIRGKKVILDSDLAALYQAGTKTLNQAVRRNLDRFPEDFMFQLCLDGGGIFEVTDCASNAGHERRGRCPPFLRFGQLPMQ
jgi:hypothetical protein